MKIFSLFVREKLIFYSKEKSSIPVMLTKKKYNFNLQNQNNIVTCNERVCDELHLKLPQRRSPFTQMKKKTFLIVVNNLNIK